MAYCSKFFMHNVCISRLNTRNVSQFAWYSSAAGREWVLRYVMIQTVRRPHEWAAGPLNIRRPSEQTETTATGPATGTTTTTTTTTAGACAAPLRWARLIYKRWLRQPCPTQLHSMSGTSLHSIALDWRNLQFNRTHKPRSFYSVTE